MAKVTMETTLVVVRPAVKATICNPLKLPPPTIINPGPKCPHCGK